MINFAAITPHPPLIIPTIGSASDRKKVIKTIKAMERLAKIFAYKKPETVIIISPHGPIAYEEMTATISPTLSGNFHMFGDWQTQMNFKNDLEIVDILQEKCQQANIPLALEEFSELDHGSLVPLYFLTKDYEEKNLPSIVPITYSFLDVETHFKFGKLIFESCYVDNKTKDKKIAVVASGDLSHRLTLNAPAGFSPDGKKFDKKLIKLLRNKDIEGILNMDKNLIKRAGECGYLSIVILLGALSKIKKFNFELFSYEGPFGVGYMVSPFLV